MELTEQLWAGQFGDEYHKRNTANDRTEYWRSIMEHVIPFPRSAIELGAGKGENLDALHKLGVHDLVGVEINPEAALLMRESNRIQVWQASISAWKTLKRFDLALVRGVLIHLPLPQLDHALELLGTAREHVIMIEYCDTHRRHIEYRGHNEMLWADDYPARFMEINGDNWSMEILESNPRDTTTCVFKRKAR